MFNEEQPMQTSQKLENINTLTDNVLTRNLGSTLIFLVYLIALSSISWVSSAQHTDHQETPDILLNEASDEKEGKKPKYGEDKILINTGKNRSDEQTTPDQLERALSNKKISEEKIDINTKINIKHRPQKHSSKKELGEKNRDKESDKDQITSDPLLDNLEE